MSVIKQDYIRSTQIQEKVSITPESEKISKEFFKEVVIDERQQNITKTKEQIWIPKAIGIISMKPFYEFFSKILIDLWFTMFFDH
jgi:hypothetical protein